MSAKENKPLNKPIREVKGNKKFKVFVKDKSTGNIKTLDMAMPHAIKKNIPQKESFIAYSAILAKVKGQKTYRLFIGRFVLENVTTSY